MEDNSHEVFLANQPEIKIKRISMVNVKSKVHFPILRLPGIIKRRKKLVIAALIFLLLLVVMALLLVNAFLKAKAFASSLQVLKDSVASQDLKTVKDNVNTSKTKLVEFKGAYRLLIPFKFVPLVSAYYTDGEHALRGVEYGLDGAGLAIDAFEPYSDVLGFSTVESAADSGEKTAQERLDFIISSIPQLTPKVGGISEKLSKAREEIEKIKVDKYPKKLFGKEIREPMLKAQELVVVADNYVKKSQPLLEVAPYLLGSDDKREYLVLFQNDKELRPTGGFLTAYSIAEVEKGKFNPVSSSDIYSLDARYRPSIPASQPVIDYIKGPYQLNKNYRLRDINWSPDFKTSTQLFLQEAQKVGIKDIDGVIAVDTQLLVNILNVLGPIGVPGYGNFSTQIEPKCDCPQVIYELESFADVEGPIVWDPLDPTRIIYAPKNIDNRKKIIGPLMNSILANSLAQPKEKIPALFEAVFKSVIEKHVLLYIHDDQAQGAVEKFGIGGTVSNIDDDFLYINDANLGGRKSNLYVTQEVNQEVKIANDGTVEKTIEITYKNTKDFDGWLNSVLPNWTRIYIPKGSEVTQVSGFEEKQNPYEEFDKTVVAGGFHLRPNGIAKVTLTYKLPFKVDREYNLLIQKQPGVDAPLYGLIVGNNEDEFYLRADKEIKIRVR